ncbi:glucuronate isomerase [Glycomyces buryatensis]|uniref:Uronate isomerase n=1 Tax=Glycomyces buryatensis TaxID=2570927 RepID=A0A4S8QJV6_9ACTN|nr:glucuronate isomerase [Glycomyces buryatensis]THV43285.1 glucuronate isomerase [Glycomyces buryatensis]
MSLHPDRLFPADERTRAIAREIHQRTTDLPLVSPHGHVDPRLMSENQPFPDPARLFVIPDHYLTRMLFSQGVTPDQLGVPSVDGSPSEVDGRTIWRRFAEHYHLFRGTPSKLWLDYTFAEVFGIYKNLNAETADEFYDHLSVRLAEPDYRPRALFDRFNIEVLATTETPIDSLDPHAALAGMAAGNGRRWGGKGGKVITTFRPDNLVEPDWPGWAERVKQLGEITGEDTSTFDGFLAALRARRQDFIAAGATCSDHGNATAGTVDDPVKAAQIFDRAIQGEASYLEMQSFPAHMLIEFARMSVEDGLVMQLHPGSLRNHNEWLYKGWGRDVGGDIPRATEYARSLKPLLDAFGNDPRFRLVLYTLDETTFSREIAPLAGGYAAVFAGAPWWFLDSPEGMMRFREAIHETAGFYNTAGFVDDTRAFCSIPARHDVARRVDAAYLSRLVADHRMTEDEAAEVAVDLAYNLPRKIYGLEK